MPTAEVVDRYLARLGEARAAPSLDALSRLHAAHVTRVPWETEWVHCGVQWSIDPIESAARIADTGRGGYCFHLNGAFSWLLAELGYEVTRHVGAVHGPDGPEPGAFGNHLVLTVGGLPTEECPQGTWYVDVAAGDALHEPVPRRAGRHRSGPFEFRLGPAPTGAGDWRFDSRERGSFAALSWLDAPAGMDAFAADHERLTTDPQSLFVQYLVVSRRDADGADLLRGLAYERAGSRAERRFVESEAELFALLGDVFRIDVAVVRAELAAECGTARLPLTRPTWPPGPTGRVDVLGQLALGGGECQHGLALV